jgi:hypothetical protein
VVEPLNHGEQTNRAVKAYRIARALAAATDVPADDWLEALPGVRERVAAIARVGEPSALTWRIAVALLDEMRREAEAQ